MEVKQFEEYLEKHRKKTGDDLTEITIETYLYLTKDLFSTKKELLYKPQELINFMNVSIQQRKNPVLFSAYKSVLDFFGYDNFKHLLVQTSIIPHSALKSTQFLQSKVLSIKEVRKLIDSSTDEEKMIFFIFYDGALRKEEFVRIKVGDITFNKFDKEKPTAPGADVDILGKGNKRRTIFLTHRTVDFIKDWITKNNLQKTDYLYRFKNKDGSIAQSQDFACWNFFIKKGKNILERHLHPHCFRHTKLTHLFDAGGELAAISRYAGHSDISITTIYVQISSFRKKEDWEKHSIDIMDTSGEDNFLKNETYLPNNIKN